MELTEGILMLGVESIINALHQLKDLGISLSVDDFGTGYSSLNCLKRFPLDALKIDRSFIAEVHTNADDAAITSAIMRMPDDTYFNFAVQHQ